MVFSGLARSARRFLMRVTSCGSNNVREADIEEQHSADDGEELQGLDDGDRVVQSSSRDVLSIGNRNARFEFLRMVPIKRKHEELECGVAISACQDGPRRGTMVDAPNDVENPLQLANDESLNSLNVQSSIDDEGHAKVCRSKDTVLSSIEERDLRRDESHAVDCNPTITACDHVDDTTLCANESLDSDSLICPDVLSDEPFKDMLTPDSDECKCVEERAGVDAASSSGGGNHFNFDEARRSETIFEGGWARPSTQLRIFVKTYLDGRTIVLHGNIVDTVDSVYRQIYRKTGLPITEQRLIYSGRQLNPEQTLEECRVEDNSTLFLVARMRSSTLPGSWILMGDLVGTIKRVCALKYMDACNDYRLIEGQHNIKARMKLFFDKLLKSSASSEHMQIFQVAGGTVAMVMLLVSPVESNRECAEESIKLFLFPSGANLPQHMHGHCAPVLWDFCKLLAKHAPFHSLYPECQKALVGLLESALKGTSCIDSAVLASIVQDSAPKINHFSTTLCYGLQQAASESNAELMSDQSRSYVVAGLDFAASLSLVCKAVEVCKAMAIPFFDQHEGYAGMLIRTSLELGQISEDDITDLRGVESWLKGIFYRVLAEFLACLAALQLTQQSERASKVSIADESPFCRTPFLDVLGGLHCIAKLYKDLFDNFLARLEPCEFALNSLIEHADSREDNSWLLHYKQLLSFASKKKLAMGMLPDIQDEYGKRWNLVVPRSDLLSKSFEELAYASPQALQKGIFVRFESEDASGPGVLREWFALVCREIFNPQNALFKCCPIDGRKVFPNPASGVNCGHLTYFRFCGRVIALALMHQIQVDVMFAVAFFKQLVGLAISWQDTRDADPVLYESCWKILQMDPEIVDADALGLVFVCEDEQLGATKTVELCMSGKDMSVTSGNRQMYVEHLVKHRYVESIREQVRSFALGFLDLMSHGTVEEFFGGLEMEDFNMILHGSGQPICLEDWKRHTEYHEYKPSDNQIIWFWKVLEKMTNEQRRKILFFCTSVAYLPAEGFAGLPSKFHIYRGHSDTTWLPTSHTCFFQLVLPRYRSLSVMREKLLAITEQHVTEGFGFA